MKKRIGSLLLILALCFTLLPTAALATDSTDTWDGTVDIRWYVGHETDTEYHITTAEQLAGLAQLVNADTDRFVGKKFYLDNDLDLKGYEWISIGMAWGGTQAEGSFCGTFDGQEHVISNLYSHASYFDSDIFDPTKNDARNALFGSVYGGEIKNLGVENAEIWIDPLDDSAAGKGILADWIGKTKITNCWTSGSIYSGTKMEKNIGGIVGVTVQGCTISGCYSTATLTGNFTNSEGFYTDPQYLSPDTIGGIVGAKYDNGLTITDCWFGGKIVVNSYWASVGGIIGYADDYFGTVTINNCVVATADIGTNDKHDVETYWVACLYEDGNAVNNYWPNDDKYAATSLDNVNANAGTAVTDFTSADVLAGLKNNAGAGVEWVAGIGHPTFVWDDNNILADYTAVDAALAKVPADLTAYTDETVTALNNAKANVVRGKAFAKQSEVDAMAKAIEDAIAALVKKPSSGGGSSSGGSSSPSYSVTTPSKTENGTVTVNPKSASKGSTVTITVKPDSGYQLDDLTVIDKNGNELKLTDKGNGKYTFTMPASKVEVNATFVKEVEISPFSDVSASNYYYEAVKWAQEKGITGGIGNGLFGPNQPCTRAQIVTFLWRAAGSPEPKSMSSFADVSTDAYYAKAVAWAVENGITTGTGDGKFSPDATCTRAQSVTFLFRAIGKLVDSKAEFSDVLTDSYYANAVAWAVENGVTNGIGDGLFGPNNSCTRAQIVTFLYRTYMVN